MPISGCAMATGEIFSALIKGVSYNPRQTKTVFSYALLAFALVETFTFILLGIVGFLYTF
jgi:F0F1-type ATP synthase membrane subunit c/vacuolar-type H+-ATPase subunit K